MLSVKGDDEEGVRFTLQESGRSVQVRGGPLRCNFPAGRKKVGNDK